MRKRITSAAIVFITILSLTNSLFAAEINISAAASMKDVLNELITTFTKRDTKSSFRKNYGGSGAIAKQIENGAPADIFISANTEWMDYLKQKKLVDEKSIYTFAYNQLVFAGKPELKTGSMQDVVKLEKIAIGSPKSVPAGEYAVKAMKKADIYRVMGKKLVMAKDVRECMLYADRGEVDGAFVYRTDALLAARNTRILFTVPQELYPRVTYPLALTTTGAGNREAAAFVSFLKSAEAAKILTKYGFKVK